MLVEVSKINKQEVTVVSSLDVAETFEKRHDDVLKSIRNLGCSDNSDSAILRSRHTLMSKAVNSRAIT